MLDSVDRTTEERLREHIDPEELEQHVDAFDGTVRVSGSDDEWTTSETSSPETLPRGVLAPKETVMASSNERGEGLVTSTVADSGTLT